MKRRELVGAFGVGAACAACCSPPVIAFVAAIGLGTALSVLTFGVVGLATAVMGVAYLVRRRRNTCATLTPVEPPTFRTPADR